MSGSAQGGARARAAVVRDTLLALWGTELPPTPDPVLDLLTDGVVVDDEAGVAQGLVVQADALTLDVLARLVTAEQPSPARLDLLPAALRGRVVSITPPRPSD